MGTAVVGWDHNFCASCSGWLFWYQFGLQFGFAGQACLVHSHLRVQDLGSVLCHVWVLKAFVLLLWVCLVYAQLKSNSRTYQVLIMNRSLSPTLFPPALPAHSLAPWSHFPLFLWTVRVFLSFSGFPLQSVSPVGPQDRAVRKEREKENTPWPLGAPVPKPLARMRVPLRFPTHRS